PCAAAVVVGWAPPAPTWMTPFMPRDTWVWQKNGKVPALGNFTVQLAPTVLILAMPQAEVSNLPSPLGLEPSPDSTGCGGPLATLKVTDSPGLMVTLAGSHLYWAVPEMVVLLAWAAAGGLERATRATPTVATSRATRARRDGRRSGTGMGLRALLGEEVHAGPRGRSRPATGTRPIVAPPPQLDPAGHAVHRLARTGQAVTAIKGGAAASESGTG